MDAKLILLVKGQPVKTIPLKRQTTTIGRAKGNTVQIPAGNVSRRHCLIVQERRGLVVKDQGSANGTFVNGQKVTEQLLQPGDLLVIGAATFRVEYQPPKAQPSAPVPEEIASVLPLDAEPAEGALAAGRAEDHRTIELQTAADQVEAFPVDEVPLVEEAGEELVEVEAIPLDSESGQGAVDILVEPAEEPAASPTAVEAAPPRPGDHEIAGDVEKDSALDQLAALASPESPESDAALEALRKLAAADEASTPDDQALGHFLAGLAEAADEPADAKDKGKKKGR